MDISDILRSIVDIFLIILLTKTPRLVLLILLIIIPFTLYINVTPTLFALKFWQHTANHVFNTDYCFCWEKNHCFIKQCADGFPFSALNCLKKANHPVRKLLYFQSSKTLNFTFVFMFTFTYSFMNLKKPTSHCCFIIHFKMNFGS